MVTSLFLGILLTLGHHLFYNSLDGKLVGASDHVIRGVTRQQLNFTLGTLFAFFSEGFLGGCCYDSLHPNRLESDQEASHDIGCH
jgi:hypothetical protein